MFATIDSVEKFTENIQKPTLSVVHFGVDYMQQCTDINDALKALSEKSDYANVQFFALNAEDLAELSMKFNIDAAPTILYFKSGIPVDRVNGADVGKITNKLNELSSAYKGETPLEEILKKLINRHKVMLFMKGDRKGPKCGFSRQMIQILDGTGVEYDTYDILTNEEVRQGLKKYSDWPTYPQLYVNGELLGGLDIIKEMVANNELMSSLQA